VVKDAPSLLPFGSLTPRTVHLCIDMQKLFLDDTPWHTPWATRVLPVVAEIARCHSEQTIFTRFVPPRTPDDLPGSWRRYYDRWRDLTRDRLDPALIELAEPLAALVPPATVIDKPVYSPFSGQRLLTILRERRADSVVVTGTETDVCVLATVLGAIDHGYRVVIARDAVCSVSDQTHDALMGLYSERFSQQVEVADAETILKSWR
jgi:nicotinamidase-related amidase